MTDRARWYDAIRSIHDRHFFDPWQDRIAGINQRYGLVGDHRLLTHGPNVPPPWFNGDIELIEPGKWVLMVSLNPRVDPSNTDKLDWYREQGFDPDGYWDYFRRFNTNYWYWKFFRPRARLAARALGEQLTRANERWFATERMLFIELCPYGSQQFGLSASQLAELSAMDEGFRLAAEVRRLVIERGRPAVVIVNGNAAVNDMEVIDRDRVVWERRCYPSVESVSGRKPGRMLWHKEGSYQTNSGRVPLIGCSFLGAIMGPNSNSEIDQLADYIREFLSTGQG